MLTILIIVAALVIFGVGVFLPRRSKRFQHYSDVRLKRLQSWAESLRQPFQFFIKAPAKMSRKITDFAAHNGRKTRKKLKGD
jgi:hypothetical protein